MSPGLNELRRIEYLHDDKSYTYMYIEVTDFQIIVSTNPDYIITRFNQVLLKKNR